jgi:uncharacterized heparinase superfamily protein
VSPAVQGEAPAANTGTELARLARMAVHLEPGQVAQRARLRAQRGALNRWPRAGRRLCAGPNPALATGWPAAFRPLDARIDVDRPRLAELHAGNLRLLGVTRALGDPPDWQQADAPLLWRFHLHYWDWAWGLTAVRGRAARAEFDRLWRSWQAAVEFGRGDAWHPYPAALRAWSWCGLYHRLVAGSELKGCFAGQLALHTGFLRRHLETDVRGNHLVKDLKALIGLAVFFADDRLLGQSVRRLTRQLDAQILPDGGHYERSPAYHCQVLGDLIDIAGLLRAAGHAAVPGITEAIGAMRRWLGGVLSPTGALPQLNDGFPVPAGLLAALRPVPPPDGPVLVLPDSGLVRAAIGGWHLLADVGAPGPRGLPGHAHAGTLGCVVHAGGAPLLVDTGTSTYAPGPVRDYERSTAAHNTLVVDGANSTEVWGAFRAGRRARIRDVAVDDGTQGGAGTVTVEAAHDGYRVLAGRPRHRRRWSLSRTGLRVDDLVTGRGRHTIVIRWHLAPGSAARPVPGGAAVIAAAAGIFRVTVAAASPVRLDVDPAPVAAGFLRTTDSPALACRITAVLPARITTWWRSLGGLDPAGFHSTGDIEGGM